MIVGVSGVVRIQEEVEDDLERRVAIGITPMLPVSRATMRFFAGRCVCEVFPCYFHWEPTRITPMLVAVTLYGATINIAL
jgi:hypothetical protein